MAKKNEGIKPAMEKVQKFISGEPEIETECRRSDGYQIPYDAARNEVVSVLSFMLEMIMHYQRQNHSLKEENTMLKASLKGQKNEQVQKEGIISEKT